MKIPPFESWLDNQLSTRSDQHLGRRIFHFVIGSVVALLFSGPVPRLTAMLTLLSLSVLLVFIDLVRLKCSWLNQLWIKVLGPLLRDDEKSEPSAQIYYLFGLCFSILFLPKAIAIQAIFTLAWLDPVAAIVGIRYGRRTWRGVFGIMLGRSKRVSVLLGAKTVEGSFAGFVFAFVAGVVAWTGPWAAVMRGGVLWWPEPELVFALSLIGALTATLAEAWPTQWDDNINIPFWTGIALWASTILLNVPTNFF